VLRIYSISRPYLGCGWAIHPLTGSLLKFSASDVPKFRAGKLPEKVVSALNFCDHPYTLNPTSRKDDLPQNDSNKIAKIYSRLSFLRKKSFFISIAYAAIGCRIYPDATIAMRALINELPSHDSEACLQRALTVAKCSKKFKTHGVVLIGAQLPLKSLHAWIVEDGVQPDPEDRQWVNFLPLLALAYP
jgi:hypothetical protein